MKKYFSTDCFKPGDKVWVSRAEFTLAGRLDKSTYIPPTKVLISEVKPSCITVSLHGYDSQFQTFYIGIVRPYLSMDDCISETKEEAIQKFNDQVDRALNYLYEDYLRKKQSILSRKI